MREAIDSIFLTGLLFFLIMMVVPNIVGKEAPFWLKAVVIVPGLAGIVAMLFAAVLLVWV